MIGKLKKYFNYSFTIFFIFEHIVLICSCFAFLPPQKKKEKRDAIGGNYLCAHLRRADFLHGRESTTPSLRAAATQIANRTRTLNLNVVFVSSDCTGQEYRDLKSYMPRLKLHRFRANWIHNESLNPGAVAIIDQIICSHAR